LWIGSALGRVERACIRSILRAGHPVTLYRYDRLDGIPEGVDVEDAASILPRAAIIRHKEGSVALFSNWFRYELQRLGKGLWLDTDQYLVAPIEIDTPHLFAFEDSRLINTGVLRLPPDSPMLEDLLAIFEQREVPFWLPPLERWRAARRLRLCGRTGLENMPWGSAGPRALTALARKHGVAHCALPPEIFYPVHYRDALWILDPSRRPEDFLTPRSLGFHLWNKIIAPHKDSPAAEGSFLERLHKEGA
jgi:hypothetical protein